jgi:hypothetical protein
MEDLRYSVTLLVSPCVGWTCFRNYVFSCDHSHADYLSLLYVYISLTDFLCIITQ